MEQLAWSHGHRYPSTPVPCCSQTVLCEGDNRSCHHAGQMSPGNQSAPFISMNPPSWTHPLNLHTYKVHMYIYYTRLRKTTSSYHISPAVCNKSFNFITIEIIPWLGKIKSGIFFTINKPSELHQMFIIITKFSRKKMVQLRICSQTTAQ